MNFELKTKLGLGCKGQAAGTAQGNEKQELLYVRV